jgi:hypothetical protein
MTSFQPPPTPLPSRAGLRQLWSQPLAIVPRGLALAREKGWVLAWDAEGWLHLFDGKGERQGQARTPGPLVAACCAEDGRHFAAVGKGGEVWWLAPDLMPRWERSLPATGVAVAMDPFGQYLASADRQGNVRLFDRDGRPVCQLESPRPLYHLLFVPASPVLVGSADYGLVASFDLRGRWLWRDGLVANVGALAVSGDGGRIALACYTEGVVLYTRSGRKDGRMALPEPSRLVALTFDGRLALVSGLSVRMRLLEADGKVRHTHTLARPAVALALGPLGETAVVAESEGPLVGLDLREVVRP